MHRFMIISIIHVVGSMCLPSLLPKKNQNKNKTQIYMIVIEKSLFQKLRACLVKGFE